MNHAICIEYLETPLEAKFRYTAHQNGTLRRMWAKHALLSEGALNVFQGVNTLHRVVPVNGDKERLVAIFAFFVRPAVTMPAKEQVGFYGRAFTA